VFPSLEVDPFPMEDVTKMIHDGQPATEASEHLANFVIQEAVSATVAAAADSLSLSGR
jgi:hypothetical protein